MASESGRQPAYLVVNADDYGYFDCVSRGILESARRGIVTATGVFATASNLDRHAGWLEEAETLDTGVHLNLTDRSPLSTDMQKRLSRWGGRFPGKFAIAGAVISGAIRPDVVKTEWRAQIEHCLEHGIVPRFLNSHEHVHMLPSLFSVTQELAPEYGIRHIRFSSPKLFRDLSPGPLVRDLLLEATGIFNRRRCKTPPVRLLGMGESGRLGIPYLEQQLPKLRPGGIYELMCHPGNTDRSEIRDDRLLQYHDWNRERETLTNPGVRDMLDNHGIQLIGYRHLAVQGQRITVRKEAA